MNVRQATHFRILYSFSYMWSLHVHAIEIHWGLTFNLGCSFGAVINASTVERSLSVLNTLSIMRVAEEQCSSREVKQRQGGKGCRGTRQDRNGKRGICSLWMPQEQLPRTHPAPDSSKTHNRTKLQLNKKFQQNLVSRKQQNTKVLPLDTNQFCFSEALPL